MPSIQPLIRQAQNYLPDLNVNRIQEAYNFAIDAHKGQTRRCGQPYIIHPYGTVRNLLRLHVDEDTIIAALLHDVPEDTHYSIQEIERKFGKEVAFLVEGITKLSKVQYQQNMQERQVESLKKLFLHSAQDLRIILIKLADRLHNMTTLEYVKDEKKHRIAQETMEIFVPMANLLGIWDIKSELEDLCFQYLYPDAYHALSNQIQAIRKNQKHTITEMVQMVKSACQEHTIHADIYGRPKNLYSIFCKIDRTKKKLIEINDLIALRIIVEHVHECYEALGIVHSLFKPKGGRVKDYIAVPKANRYQSLHTTVFGLEGITTEFQIRTKNMHLEAEYGIAAHYFYKQETNSDQSIRTLCKDRPLWIQKILDIQKQQKDDEDFIKHLKLDVFQDRIFVFTPKGDVIDLPKGALALDFAYAVHTDIGHGAVKAEINRRIVSLKTRLATGDTVNIITLPNKKGPDREWLAYVVTNLAKNHIKDFFRQQSLRHKMRLGRLLLKKEIEHAGKIFDLELRSRRVAHLLKKLNLPTVDALFIALGAGNLDTKQVFNIMYDEKSVQAFTGSILRRKYGAKNILHYCTVLQIFSKDYIGLFQNLGNAVSSLGVNTIKAKITTNSKKGTAHMTLHIEVHDFNELSKVFEALEEVDGVYEVKRDMTRRWVWFGLFGAAIVAFWAVHPFLIDFLSDDFVYHSFASNALLYVGFGMLFLLLVILHRVIERNFPELKNTKIFWLISFSVNTLMLATTVLEIHYYHLRLNWLLALGVIFLVYAYLISEYLAYRKYALKWGEGMFSK